MAFTFFDTLVHGFQHKELTLHDVLQVTNPWKGYITEPGIEKKYHFLAPGLNQERKKMS